MPESRPVPMARDIMATSLVTLRQEDSIFHAIRVLLNKGISGAPVVDDDGQMVGVLSELDCLRVLSSDEFYAGHQEEAGTVSHFMTSAGLTIPSDLDLYGIAHYFLTTAVRRLPVVDDGRLLGQVSRRDVLRGIQRLMDRPSAQRRPGLREISRSWSAL